MTYAVERKHEYATTEHLLLALIDDEDANRFLKHVLSIWVSCVVNSYSFWM